jgi:hypothetical protein
MTAELPSSPSTGEALGGPRGGKRAEREGMLKLCKLIPESVEFI